MGFAAGVSQPNMEPATITASCAFVTPLAAFKAAAPSFGEVSCGKTPVGEYPFSPLAMTISSPVASNVLKQLSVSDCRKGMMP